MQEDMYSEVEKEFYIFDMVTKEFKQKSITPHDDILSKIEGKKRYYKINPDSTFIPPPEITSDIEVAVFNEDNIKWEIKPDFRGCEYSIKGKITTITNIGETVPSKAKIVKPRPPKSFRKPTWINGEWVDRSFIYKDKYIVETKLQVDKVTSKLISALGEEKAKTLKMIAGSGSCAEWDKFVSERDKLIKEGNDFITKNNLP
jgi:hypothetical protein